MSRGLYTSLLLLLVLTRTTLAADHFSETTSTADERVVNFGKQIEASIESRNPYFFNLSFDPLALVDGIFGQQDTSFLSNFNQGFSDGVKATLDLGAMIIDEMGNEGSFKFIRAYNKEDGAWMIFRIITSNGINYHEYKVEIIDGNYKITDGYFYLSGDKLSETLRLIYDRNVALFRQHVDADRQWMLALNDLDKIKLEFSKSHFKRAYKHWQKTPDIYRQTKAFQYTGINIAAFLEQEVYMQVYQEYMANYPPEPAKYLIPLDGLVLHGNYELALQCLDSLEDILLSDPLLDYFRAKIYYLTDNLEKSELYLAHVIKSIPDFEMAYISLLNIYLNQKKFEQATGLLDQITLTFNAYKKDLYPFLTDYPDYLNSSVYKNWIEQ